MTDQLAFPLSDPLAGRCRRTDPASSLVAARTVDAQGQRSRILQTLRGASRPMNVQQIVSRTGIPRDQVASRLPVMHRAGQVALLPELGLNHLGKPVQLWSALGAEVDDVPVKGERL